ncbi:MAG: hypothetical protein JNL80_10380 [Phycisphaerae bacterium]|jgi:hypothetical protein|nr:hypothetical protein [Phycisphaerae bacterium]
MVLAPVLLAGHLALNTCREIDIAFDTDVEFVVRRCGADEFALRRYVNDLVVRASAITSASLDVRLRVATIRIRTGSARSDPWNAPIADDQLAQFRDHWNAHEAETPRDMTILLSGRDMGGSPSFQGSIGTAEAYAILAQLGGSASERHDADLIDLLRAVGTVCGAPRTDECEVEACETGPGRGSIMSLCDACPGGVANIDLTFAGESIEAIWHTFDQAPHSLGSTESGLVAAQDFVYVVAGTDVVIDAVANDLLTNCGPVTLVTAPSKTPRGWALAVVDEQAGPRQGERSLLLRIPDDANGTDVASYTITDSDEAVATGTIELVVRSADFNADGRVDAVDLQQVMDRMGDRGATAEMVDLNGDRLVSTADLGLLLSVWSASPGS